MSLQTQVDTFDQLRALRRAVIEGSDTAIRRVGSNIDTPDALREGARVIRELISGELSPDSNHPSQTDPGVPRIGHVAAALPTGAEQQWIGWLTQALTEINQWGYPLEQRRRLSSAILYLIAELLRDDNAEEERLKAYADDIFTIAHDLRPTLSHEQNRLIMFFKNYEQLRHL